MSFFAIVFPDGQKNPFPKWFAHKNESEIPIRNEKKLRKILCSALTFPSFVCHAELPPLIKFFMENKTKHIIIFLSVFFLHFSFLQVPKTFFSLRIN
jgi:hypothetical protein